MIDSKHINSTKNYFSTLTGAFENSRSDNTDDTYENLELFREQIRTETNKAYAVFKRDEDQDSVEYETITDHMEHSTGVYSDLLVGITLFEDISSGMMMWHRYTQYSNTIKNACMYKLS